MGEGETGEVVATIFNPSLPPDPLRHRRSFAPTTTETCACGRTSAKLTRIMGRVDQVTKIKGMFVHPGGVKQVADHFPEVAAYQLLVERDGHKDVMTLVCELTGGVAADLGARMEAAMKDVLRVSGGVRFVERGTLAEGCKVIEDRRKWD